MQVYGIWKNDIDELVCRAEIEDSDIKNRLMDMATEGEKMQLLTQTVGFKTALVACESPQIPFKSYSLKVLSFSQT